jgi:ribonuclease HI
VNQDTHGTIENADVKKGKEYSHCFCVLWGDSNYLLESMTIWIKNFGQKVRKKQKHIVVNSTVLTRGFSIWKEKKKQNKKKKKKNGKVANCKTGNTRGEFYNDCID